MGRSGWARIHDLAALLIERQHEAGLTIDKMQLQKLLYLVQQSHITRTGVPAADATFRAYRHGPVVPEVEDTYRGLTPGREPLPRSLGGHPEEVPDEVVSTVDEVLHFYGGWTALNLERHVKRGDTPWRRARRGVPDGADSRNPIDLDDIVDWAMQHAVDPVKAVRRVSEPSPDDSIYDLFTSGADEGESDDASDDLPRWKRRPEGPLLTLDD